MVYDRVEWCAVVVFPPVTFAPEGCFRSDEMVFLFFFLSLCLFFLSS
jgi:hypothetical protein